MSQQTEQPQRSVVLVDAHVHLHAQFSIPTFLGSAVANFQRASAETNAGGEWMGCLMFADIGRQDSLAAIESALRAADGGPFREEVWQEGLALAIRVDDRPRLLCLAGRQLTSEEGIEMLALATSERFEQRRPLTWMMQQTGRCDALAVIPWGAGKWIFRRGALIAELVDRAARGQAGVEFFLGDNRLRPRQMPAPRLLRKAVAAGIGILPGSDALPLRWHGRAAGSYGFVVPGTLPERKPADWLRDQLRSRRSPWNRFGRPSSVGAFVRDQAAAQWRKLRARNTR